MFWTAIRKSQAMRHYIVNDRVPSIFEKHLTLYYLEEMFKGKTKKARDEASRKCIELNESRKKKWDDFMEYYNKIN